MGRTVPTANDALAERASRISWGATDLRFVAGIWPPLPTAIAGIVAGGTVLLAVIGGLVGGCLLHVLAERLILAGQPRGLVALAAATVGAAPGTAYLADVDLASILALLLVVMAAGGILRFVRDGRTDGAFLAGLLLALAAMCNAAVGLVAVVLAAATPLLLRGRRSAGAAGALACVILFPTVAAAAGWAFLEWRFTGEVFAALRGSAAFTFPAGAGPGAAVAAAHLGQVLVCSPLYVAVVVLLLRRSATATLGLLLPLPVLALALWWGIGPPVGLAILGLTCAGVLALPAAARSRPAIAAIMAAQCVISFTLALWWDAPVALWWTQLLG